MLFPETELSQLLLALMTGREQTQGNFAIFNSLKNIENRGTRRAFIKGAASARKQCRHTS